MKRQRRSLQGGRTLLVWIAGCLAACQTAPGPARALGHPLLTMQLRSKMESLQLAGATTALGMGQGASAELAQDEAVRRGRAKLAQIAAGRLDAIRREAAGAGATNTVEELAFFGQVSQTLAQQTLTDGEPVLTQQSAGSGGIHTCWAVLVFDPQLLVTAIHDALAQDRSFKRVLDSRTFRTMAKDAANFSACRLAHPDWNKGPAS